MDSKSDPTVPPGAVADRNAFLVNAGVILADSLDYEATLTRLTRLVVPDLADVCIVDIDQTAGDERRGAFHARTDELAAVTDALLREFRRQPDGNGPVEQAWRTGESRLCATTDADAMAARARSPRHAELLRRLAIRSLLVVPIVTRGATIGVISLISGSPDRYGPADVATVEALARRAALAIDHARLYEASQTELAERRRMEGELREQTARYEALLQAQSDLGLGVMLHDSERIHFANPATCAILGRSQAELAALPAFVDLLVPEERPHFIARLRRRRADGIAEERYTMTVLRADGSRADVEVGTTRLTTGDGRRWLAILRDVTQHRADAAALRANEARFRAVFEHAAIGLVIAGPDRLPIQVNPAFERFLGYSLDELRLVRFDHFTHPDDLPRHQELDAELLAQKRDWYEIEKRYRRRDGEHVWGNLVTTAVRDAEGTLEFTIGLVEDVTDRKEAERQRELLARTEKLRALGQMASGVAHDLNQSLSLIAGHGELALAALDAGDADPATLRNAFRTIVRAAFDGAQTVRRLQTFTRPENEDPGGEVVLGDLLHEVAELTAPGWRDAAQAQGRTIRVEVAVHGATTIVGLAGSLREALTNLVFNAVDALPEGGTIRLIAAEAGPEVHVTVTDDGVGMTPDVRERLFEPFFTTKGERGSGLGLPVVYGIVERHRGMITVDSTPGRGTAVRLAFPGAGRHRPPQAKAETVPTVAALRVLAVDDEPGIAHMVRLMLEGDGHRVATATSADEAIGLLDTHEFDVVISDLGLGVGRNGWELAAEVRARRAATRFVLATGWGASIDPADARSRGVSAVLAKPYRRADLQRVVAEPNTAPPAGPRPG